MNYIVSGTVLFLLMLIALPHIAHAQEELILFNVRLGCSPSGTPGGSPYPLCGPTHFLVLIEVIIDFLSKSVVLPVAVLMIIWGGFNIITAGGNTSKFEKGRTIITVALVGVIISFTAALIVGIIVDLLGPPGGLPSV